MHLQLQFEKQAITCLRRVKHETQNQEQTQELRISDGMPDIGSIIGAWGQVILRGKEWQSDMVSVSGGTKVWIQYVPEEGGEIQCVESWLPFQMRWDIPQTQHDGVIQAQCYLRSVDARSTSARKLMVRTNVAVVVCALQEREQELYSPGNLPEDIQQRSEMYPVELPVEAGEKALALEETLVLPSAAPPVEQLLRYHLQPQITEIKMVADKVVFRGNANLHIHYKTAEGGIHSWDLELPFTQYSELQKEYTDDARVQMFPCVTALEIDREEDRYQVKTGIVCQYRINQRHMVETVTDTYSPHRETTPEYQQLQLPGILETRTETIHPQISVSLDAMRLADVQFLPEPFMTSPGEEGKLYGRFQVLYYDMEGQLRTAIQPWEQMYTQDAGSDVTFDSMIYPSGKTQWTLMSGSVQLSTDMQLVTESIGGSPIDMVIGIEAGELRGSDPNRPSLILRRTENTDLWNLAKKAGSTEVAIREANGLQSDPEPDRMLLIPIV